MSKLAINFYTGNNVVKIARHLLGKRLMSRINGVVTGGTIVETEAYSFHERGCHAYQNRMTQRNKVMFETGGIAYVYLCYGIHHLFNVVTNRSGVAEAVLIRALEPVWGIDIMQQRMEVRSVNRITSGPGKLTKALGIDRAHNGIALVGEEIWIENGKGVSSRRIIASPRIGVDYAGADALLPWRFTIRNNPWVSR
jgi:DNA-3-methyladenine glycosylase